LEHSQATDEEEKRSSSPYMRINRIEITRELR